MDPLIPHGLFGRALARLPIIASAALVAVALVTFPEHPIVAACLLAVACGALIPPIIARVRFRRLLLSGDVQRVLAAWRRSLQGAPHAEAAEPLMSAIAFAAYGWVDEARAQLQRARFQSEGIPNVEHLLFVETLVEAFDGDRDQAMESANTIAALPIPNVGTRLQRRVLVLRASLVALTRAFAHRARAGDLEILEHVAHSSPLVSWAMRYAAAIVAIDRNELARARALIEDAPSWPEQSAFRSFQAEIEGLLAPHSASTPP